MRQRFCAEPGVELSYSSEDSAKGVALRGKIKLEDTLADIAAAVEAASVQALSASSAIAGAARLPSPAAQHVEGLAASVGYYGSGIAALPKAQLRCPVMLQFGDQDKSIPLSDIEKIRRAHPDITIHIYPAGHGFSCNARSSYDEASATQARERALEFFEKNIV